MSSKQTSNATKNVGGITKFAPGTQIWVACAENVWKRAEVLSTSDDALVVRTEDTDGSTSEVKLAKGATAHLCNPDAFSEDGLTGLDDLTQLAHLHEAAVLHSLNIRFDTDKIYTYTGPILLAVNPFKTIPGLYDIETLRYFMTHPQVPGSKDRIPHVFATAEGAYCGLCQRHACQTVLISGESGAGKTESTKFVMKHLALAGSPDWNNRSQIENQVLQSNPLLETFGNSKTLRNDNSSRFGKFIEMQFNLEHDREVGGNVGRLAGARIHTYLLETVRICHQLQGERNYHSFYQACAAGCSAYVTADGMYQFPSVLKNNEGCQPFQISVADLGPPEQYRYLTRSSCTHLDGVDDLHQFEMTLLAMQTISIPLKEIQDTYKLLSTILLLGNLEFEQSGSDGSKISTKCTETATKLSHLLGVDNESLQALVTRTIRTKSETFKKPLTVSQADDTRDALARSLYGTMFLKIVQRTNASIGYREDVSLFCGVLDIFGFECFDFNSFEQLCINYTNERLQQFFNTFIFKCEEELYRTEGITWDPLDFPDNADAVEILQSRPFGIFSMLDEECIVPQGSDKGWCYKLKERHKEHRRFDVIRTRPDWFVVNHFAGPVNYCSDGFLEKNKDLLSNDIQDLVKSSRSEFIRTLFLDFLNRGSEDVAATNSNKKKPLLTVSSEFRQQLNYLMETVDKTEPHFIRCIKPNPQNSPDSFHRSSVTEQLRYGGVLQAVQVSRAGFPVRLSHRDALLDFRILLSEADTASVMEIGNDKDRSQRMMTILNEQYQIPKPKHSETAWGVGNNMLFLKHEAFEILSRAQAERRFAAAVIVQSRWKGLRQRRFFGGLRTSVVKIQAFMRGHFARKEAMCRRRQKAAIKLQSWWRMVSARHLKERCIQQTIRLQSMWKAHKARQQYWEMRRNKAAIMLQSHWKGYKTRTYYKSYTRAIILAQLRWKQILAKRTLLKLKKEACEVRALLEQKRKLQDEVLKMKHDLTLKEAELMEERKKNEKLQLIVEEAQQREEALRNPTFPSPALVVQVYKIMELEPKEVSQEIAIESKVDAPQILAKDGRTIEAELEKLREEKEELSRRLAIVQMSPPGLRAPNLPSPFTVLQVSPDSTRTPTVPSDQGEVDVSSHLEYGSPTTRLPPMPTFNTNENIDVATILLSNNHELEELRLCLEEKNMEILGLKARISELEGRLEVDMKQDMKQDVKSLVVQPCKPLQKQNKQVLPTQVSTNPVQIFRHGWSTLFGCSDKGFVRPGSLTPPKVLLRPSMKGTSSMLVDHQDESIMRDGDLLAVEEVHEGESAITYVTFGRENASPDYILLATGAKDGSVVVFRCYRTDTEKQLYRQENIRDSRYNEHNIPSEHHSPGHVVVQTKMSGHTKAITSILFTLTEEHLVTTSVDRTVRFWSVETGDILKVFSDSSPALVAAYLPLNPTLFVAANSNAILRLVNIQNGQVLQKLKFDAEVRAIKFDDTGIYCLTGTKNGSIHVLEAVEATQLKFRFKVQLTKAAITNIAFFKQWDDMPSIAVNACDNTLSILDCSYNFENKLTTLVVHQRLRIPQSLLPLRACFSSYGGGWLVSASEDKDIHAFSLTKKSSYKATLLKHHQVPVLAVATNELNTLLVSADTCGKITLWRRFSFSHLQEYSTEEN